MSKSSTVGDELINQVRRIAEAMELLKAKGLPKDILVLWIQKKTKLPQRDIIAVLDALSGIKQAFDQPIR